MRIVIDMQGAQTESRYRGVGRYTMSFARAVVRNRGEHEIILALNGLFPKTVERIREAFSGLLPPESIRVWNMPGPVRVNVPGNDTRRELAELVREAFLLGLQPDLIHVGSLFEGHVDDAVTSIDRLGDGVPVSLSLHDLIPLVNADRYLQPDPNYADYYHQKIRYLQRATICLANSESTRQEGLCNLRLKPSRIVNVSTAIDPHFRPLPLEERDENGLRARLRLRRPFILYTGGSDERKNLPRLFRAFAMLPASVRSHYALVLAGKVSQGERDQLARHAVEAHLGPEDVLFTGYVSDEELVHLYNLCALFVFPSWHEGFGLPPLEAMACGAPVIAANRTSLPEVIGLPEALFDPFDVRSIADKMLAALEDREFRSTLREHGLHQSQRFSWDTTAMKALGEWERLVPTRPDLADTWRESSEHFKCVHKTLVTAIADVSMERKLTDPLLGDLARCMEQNEREIYGLLRAKPLPTRIQWRIEGPFDSTYSLALLNRETARALAALGHEVALHATEGPGDFDPDPDFLAENPDLAAMHRRARDIPHDIAHVTSRNLYPPRVADMTCRLNLLHGYGWEEWGFPHEWVEDFNIALQGISVVSEHVRKVLIDNGVSVPIDVSGNGVDHWERISADTRFHLETRSFRFLHVSSCFPRKGVDVLLQAFGEAFSDADDVSLLIKTFPNPHNKIHHWLEDAKCGNPSFPDVKILEGDLTDEELKALFEQSHALVAPSRAEGFGLPMAEAMLSRLPVITTGWSGQTDFCTPETAWLVDYRFAMADTHFELFDSVWAEPDVSELAGTMREVYELPAELRGRRAAKGRDLLLARSRWLDVAERLTGAARQWAKPRSERPPRIGWVTTWNTRCGIAVYSQHLIENFPAGVTVLAAEAQQLTQPDEENVRRCWTAGDSDRLHSLRDAVANIGVDTLIVQFNFGLFNPHAFCEFLSEQVADGQIVFVWMHATKDPDHVPEKKLSMLIPALAQCHRILVHTVQDLNRMKEHGLVHNVMLFPHGVLDPEPGIPARRTDTQPFRLASFGFFLPNKGLLELIEATHILRRRGLDVCLNLVNAEYLITESSELVATAKEQVRRLDLESVVTFHTDYLDDADSLELLGAADLVVFPYQRTGESASGAVRYGIASGTPVAVTPLSIFDDVDTAVHRLLGFSATEIAEGIAAIINAILRQDATIADKALGAQRWRAAHRYPALSERLYGTLLGVRRQRNDASQLEWRTRALPAPSGEPRTQ